MRSILRGSAAIGTALVIAACGGNNPAPSVPASQAGTPAAATCQDTTEPGTVQATVAGFKWSAVSAKVGDVVTWTNSDSAPHAVALDDGSCAMSGNIDAGGGTRSLKFNVAGSFPFHCSVHPTMKGTITIT